MTRALSKFAPPDLLARWEESATGAPGRPRKNEKAYNISLKKKHGTSKAYSARRLARAAGGCS
jgi:hypothetical protein